MPTGDTTQISGERLDLGVESPWPLSPSTRWADPRGWQAFSNRDELSDGEMDPSEPTKANLPHN